MYGRRPTGRADLTDQLAWLRAAAADPNLNTRLVVAGLVDALAAAVDLIPGPPPKDDRP